MNVKTLRFRIAMLLAGLLAASFGAAATQPARDLSILTVPEDRLPTSCRLKPAVPRPLIAAQRGVVVMAAGSEPNPLISRDRRVAADIRRLIDGAPPEPDGPPLMPRNATAWASSWVQDVVQAYRATYRQTDESLITVAAIQFNHERLATTEPPAGTRSAPRGMTSRIVLGSTVVLIAANASSDCFRAIESYPGSVR
jgi:hypothetical protein